MRLRIVDPTTILVDTEVTAVNAEDASGRFGVLARHADFLTALTISVVSWKTPEGKAGYCAVRKGILTVSGGQEVAIATREGHVGTDLATLKSQVLVQYQAHDERERAERTASTKLRMQAIRNMVAELQGSDTRGFGL